MRLIFGYFLLILSLSLLCDKYVLANSPEEVEKAQEQKNFEKLLGRRRVRRGDFEEHDPRKIIPGRVYVRGRAAPLPDLPYEVDGTAAKTEIDGTGWTERLRERREAKEKIRAARKAAKGE